MRPPEALLLAQPQPVFEGTTNADVITYVQALKEWGAACQLDKHWLGEWAHGRETGRTAD